MFRSWGGGDSGDGGDGGDGGGGTTSTPGGGSAATSVVGLSDDAGNHYDRRVRFDGEVAGERHFDASDGIDPGETVEGVAVTQAPAGTDPLYLLWSPPTIYWRPGIGVDVNRYVWQLR